MTNDKPFLEAEFLAHLERMNTRGCQTAGETLDSALAAQLLAADNTQLSNAGRQLIALLQAKRTVRQAASDTILAADELRRYQKFVEPGQPSPHIVGLRQKQGAARQASSVARQSFVKAAAAFVREAGIDVPQRVALEAFVDEWIEANVPKDVS